MRTWSVCWFVISFTPEQASFGCRLVAVPLSINNLTDPQLPNHVDLVWANPAYVVRHTRVTNDISL